MFGLPRECLWSTARAEGRRDGSASGSRHDFWEASTGKWQSALQLVTQRARKHYAPLVSCGALLFAREVLVARCALVYSRRAPPSCYSYRCLSGLPRSRSEFEFGVRCSRSASVRVETSESSSARDASGVHRVNDATAAPAASFQCVQRTYMQIAIYSRVRPPRFSLRRLFTTANRCHLCLRSSPGPQLPLN